MTRGKVAFKSKCFYINLLNIKPAQFDCRNINIQNVIHCQLECLANKLKMSNRIPHFCTKEFLNKCA